MMPSTFSIEIDATPLFFRYFIVPGKTPEFVDARRVQTLELEPGSYSYQTQAGSYADFTFVVDAAGGIDYDAAFDGFLAGRGTSRLTVVGLEVTLDASRLTGADRGGGVLLAETPLTADDFINSKTCRLIPQTYYQVQQSSGVVASFTFALKTDGTFSYDPAFDTSAGGFLAGNGTSTLKFLGYPLGVDASAVSQLLIVVPIWGFTATYGGMASIVVLPAQYFSLQLDSGVTDLTFSMGVDGSVVLDPSMAGLLVVDSGDSLATVRVLPYQSFVSPIYGRVNVKGRLFGAWQGLAAQTTSSGGSVQTYLGLPVEGQQSIALDKPYEVQRFERGMLIDIQSHDRPYVVYGAIYLRYHALGEMAFYGSPNFDELPATSGGGRFSPFEQGDIYWHPDHGAWEVHGQIRLRWLGLGGVDGMLGYPISDELPVLLGGAEIGRVSRFESRSRDGQPETVASVYWSPSTGAWEIYGPILLEWQQNQGGPAGPLGLPTSGPQPTPNGVGRVQTFQNGLIVWHSDTGAVSVTGGVALNLFDYTVSNDDFNVQINITSRVNGAPGPENHGRMPADGQYGAGQQSFGPLALLTIDRVTADLVIAVQQMEALSENTVGDDTRQGNVAPIVYDVDNLWGLRDSIHTHHNDAFSATLAVQRLIEPAVTSDQFRQQAFWPFHNFDTADLSWAQYEATFRDVAEVDKHISIIPPRMHLGEIALYEAVYKSLARSGNCFGMCLEAIYAREHRSLFDEPVFSANGYRKDGLALVPDNQPPAPENAEVANEINIKMGYQIGSEQIGWFLGKWSAGALHNPVRAFRDSRDAYARGDWPILTLSDYDKFSQSGHVVLPYRWDPSTEEQIAAQPLSGQTWTISVANPNSPAAGSGAPGDADDTCKVVIRPFEETWRCVIGRGEAAWTGSSSEGGRLLTMPYSVLCSRPTTLTDVIFRLFDAGILLVLGGDAHTSQMTDGNGRTLFRIGTDGIRRIEEDPASRIPDLALLPFSEAEPNGFEAVYWRPDSATAATQLVHQLNGAGNYAWSLHTAALSAHVVASGTEGLGDQVLVDALGTASQTFSVKIPADGTPKTLQVSVAGFSGSDVAQSRWFELANITAVPGQTLRAQVLDAGRSLSVHNDGPDMVFDLHVHSGLDNDPLTSRTAIQLPAGKAWRIAPNSWDTTTQNVGLSVVEMDHIGGAPLRIFTL